MAKAKILHPTTINKTMDDFRKKQIAESEKRMAAHFKKSLSNPEYRKLHGMALSEN